MFIGVQAKEMKGWDPLLRNEDYASSSSDEENEQENEGSRNGEKSILIKELHDIISMDLEEMAQKAKVHWAIEGDENSKYFHGILNNKRSHLAIRGVLVNGDWIVKPNDVKNEFLNHFSSQFDRHVSHRICLAVWDCGTNKFPGHDGFTFEFFRRYWKFLENDISVDVMEFFSSCTFPKGCNSSFIALIPTTQNAKTIKDFRPISLIGSLYKIIVKILANRLSSVIPDLISFISNRQILDGPFILNELLSWCKYKKLKAMVFKVAFEKAFDSIRWDYLDDVLKSFGFGDKWRGWISGLFTGIPLDNSLTISHLFYANDAIFVGKWDSSNLKIILKVLKCSHMASGLKININKSKLMGYGVHSDEVETAARYIGCLTCVAPFSHLEVKVGGRTERINSWDDVVSKVTSQLSKWKLKTLSIGGRLTLIKSVLTSIPLYQMSSFKVPIKVLNILESIRRKFFNGIEGNERKPVLISWDTVLASKKYGGLGVSNTLFWEDSWFDGISLKQQFSRLYSLESAKHINVAEKMNHPSLSWSYRREPRGGIEEEQQNMLFSKISCVILPNMRDRWIWSFEASKDFSVTSARRLIDDYLLPKGMFKLDG
nr:RNA-directed DNA polymerase, eukaryota [Tanacetum cinerariifolium]